MNAVKQFVDGEVVSPEVLSIAKSPCADLAYWTKDLERTSGSELLVPADGSHPYLRNCMRLRNVQGVVLDSSQYPLVDLIWGQILKVLAKAASCCHHVMIHREAH